MTKFKFLTHSYLTSIFLLPLLFACVALVGCATQTANETTTAGSTAATVDVPGTIAAGASVTSTNTATGTVVSSITGSNLVINPAATGTGTVAATFKNTTAVQLANDEKAYEQTLGGALQTVLPLISGASGATAALGQVATVFGLEPANPTQNTAFSNIQSDLKKASSSATLVENYLTGLQTNGVAVATSN